MPFFHHFLYVLDERVDLGARIIRARFVNQTWMARGLTKSEQCFENLNFGFAQPLRIDHAKQRLAIMILELVVHLPLGGLEFTVDSLFGLVRQIACNLRLSPTQYKWP